MNKNHRLEFAVATRDVPRAQAIAAELGGNLYVDENETENQLPFRALLTTVSDRFDMLEALGEFGLYVVNRRPIIPGESPAIGLFPLVRRAALSHQQADAHWRDVHAPLALKHHRHMTQYVQLSVVHRISGPEIDGFALCGFGSLDDLRNRFFSEPDSREVIRADIDSFIDTKRSPRRLVATETRY